MNLVFVKPAQIPIAGICATRVLTSISRERTAEQLTDVKVTIKPHSDGESQDTYNTTSRSVKRSSTRGHTHICRSVADGCKLE